MASPIPPVIILVRPQLPENGGAAARAMGNFGLKALRFVAPLFPPLDPKAVAMTAGAETILKNATIFSTLDESAADLGVLTQKNRHVAQPSKHLYPDGPYRTGNKNTSGNG